ncbi:aspartyl-phosphate phosphatase Spo0E family protein [Domibacillus sp. 8LH]|uniref:aspartyl-phosphate phosphatase Spo0E family protein n=1 Tax=Domibacillus TaxID=1433999 RepID=UPI001F59F3D3|nr:MULTISPECIES: aspartyl-phosphate phosphatase Spo0E family protein [Domibacillus]MCI2254174.1 aspartyl-phosphate phosphatase Spo0E family protein [Domibacillus sp. PGB-M46]MCM3787429.1 aspartyl-phosphate phosphatase Spo0E family protein [Domibacillus indicus]WNS79498.1 aspartyl-phosphate phosphatase Spo0E family protein [Domibacillus sp. DTU_2020_1001157_1_SI_ALB_TIR_016]
MDTNQPILEELSFQIKKLRHLMILAAAIYGFGSEEVLGYSQELDKLIIEYQLQTS